MAPSRLHALHLEHVLNALEQSSHFIGGASVRSEMHAMHSGRSVMRAVTKAALTGIRCAYERRSAVTIRRSRATLASAVACSSHADAFVQQCFCWQCGRGRTGGRA